VPAVEDDGREEAYEERGISAAGIDSGVISRAPEDRAELRARQRVAQEDADQGRNPFGIPYLGRARDRAKVRHRAWLKHPNGWFTCNRCAFPAWDDPSRILHQDGHKVRDDQADELYGLLERCADRDGDLGERMDVVSEELAGLRLLFHAFLIATGNPTDEALQGAVERVMSSAREINARGRVKGE
jgi:hypothetical protein